MEIENGELFEWKTKKFVDNLHDACFMHGRAVKVSFLLMHYRKGEIGVVCMKFDFRIKCHIYLDLVC